MTLTAFHVQPDHAEILIDSLTYSKSGRSMGTATKIHLLPHLDAAMMVPGDGNLHAWWAANLPQTDDAADFDEFDEITQELLPGVCDELEGDRRRPLAYDTTVFHVGWSPARGRFVAYGYPSAFEFERQDLTEDLFVYPAPTSGQPPPSATTEAWVDLAKQLRRERALAPMGSDVGKVFIGGAVLLTRLERGTVTTRRVHVFDDAGDEFAEIGRSHCPPCLSAQPVRVRVRAGGGRLPVLGQDHRLSVRFPQAAGCLLPPGRRRLPHLPGQGPDAGAVGEGWGATTHAPVAAGARRSAARACRRRGALWIVVAPV